MDIQAEISKLSPKSGDTVIVRLRQHPSYETVEKVMLGLKANLPADVHSLVIVGDELTLETVSEDDMRRRGWIRADRAPDSESVALGRGG